MKNSFIKTLRPFIGAILLASGFMSHAAVTTLIPKKTVHWENYLGVNAHFLWFSPEQYETQMRMLRDLGLRWVRVDMHWDQHEPVQGQFLWMPEVKAVADAINEHDLKSVFYLVGSAPFITSAPSFMPYKDTYPPKDPKVYADRIAQLSQYLPTVNAWQVWNEPNLPAFWRPVADPEGYGRLLLASANALRKVFPDKPVVIGGMAYYSQMPVRGGLMLEALAQIGLKQLNTIIAYHPYAQYPEGDTPEENDFIVRVQMLNALIREHLSPPEIWATEWGWSSYAGPKEEQEIIGETGQADYVLRRLALTSALDFDRIFLFTLSDLDDRASIRDRSYGLLDLQGNPKPVYHALRQFLGITGSQLTPGNAPEIHHAPDTLYSIPWLREDGKRIWMFWGTDHAQVTLPHISEGVLFEPLNSHQESLKNDNGLNVPVKPTLQILVY